ncbi:Jag N-terminal domain-containing protein [Alicyclobacillus fastidiosus]|uniref:RNA-binding protein KhpB n=1 Tax=Alicyclobacillus fastidiosus TaxID=392011 RepID=A0ABY6ZGJ4_9BACL|nr:RNA-binding cell elongation regulator Jag/EloR [Alicyclobacillus fastidiosus]WAH41956.1 Jag N-terminal domain-containing protein [Alicyclobacillus fastidiosus]GMA63682.1 DNA-binding protein [Alicyclobacillus fastidiosus]
MKRLVVTGRSVEEAVTSALVKLGVPRSQAQVRVISEPVKGLFGFLGGKDAEVEVSVPQSPLENARDFVETVLGHMGVSGQVSLTRDAETDAEYLVNIESDEEVLPFIIGRHGSTLDSLQYLVNIVANREHDGFVKFSVDAGEYRKRRRESLRRAADHAADRAVRTGRAVSMDAMSPADRKWVHTYLQTRSDVTTLSEGEEPYRKVRIAPKRNSYKS